MRLIVTILFAILLIASCSPKHKTVPMNVGADFHGRIMTLRNRDTFAYNDLHIVLNQKYTYVNRYLAPGDTTAIDRMEFADAEGNRFGYMRKPQSMELKCILQSGDTAAASGTFE